MEIKRFENNNVVRSESEFIPVKSIQDYISDFDEAIGDYSHDWIAEKSQQTKLKEYKNESLNTYGVNKYAVIKFAEKKQFPNLKEYILKDDKISELQKEIAKIEKQKESLYIKVADEVQYKFQLELLEQDFDKFYYFYLSDAINDFEEEDSELNNIYIDIHPNIIKNKKYKNLIDTKLLAKKYNIV